MFGLFSLFGVPDFVTKEAEKQIRYLTSDQEAEGRELGIKKAAEIYAPILKDLELKQNRLLEDLDKSSIEFGEKAEYLSKQVDDYERKIAELEEAIYKMKQESVAMGKIINSTIEKQQDRKNSVLSKNTESRSIKLKNAIKSNDEYCNVETDRNVINKEMVACKQKRRNFSIGVDIISLSVEFLPIKFFGDYLEEKMEKKRQAFFKKALAEKTKVWEEKIQSVKQEIDNLFLRLISLENSNASVLNEIKMILDDVIYDYLEKSEQYNALKSVEKML